MPEDRLEQEEQEPRKEVRDFKGIWIPKNVYLDKGLSWIEKVLLLEIDSLDKGKGCYASNSYMASFLNVKEKKVANILTDLRKRGYVETVKFDGRKRWLKAHLTPKKGKQPSQKTESRIPENGKAARKNGYHKPKKNNGEKVPQEAPINKVYKEGLGNSIINNSISGGQIESSLRSDSMPCGIPSSEKVLQTEEQGLNEVETGSTTEMGCNMIEEVERDEKVSFPETGEQGCTQIEFLDTSLPERSGGPITPGIRVQNQPKSNGNNGLGQKNGDNTQVLHISPPENDDIPTVMDKKQRLSLVVRELNTYFPCFVSGVSSSGINLFGLIGRLIDKHDYGMVIQTIREVSTLFPTEDDYRNKFGDDHNWFFGYIFKCCNNKSPNRKKYNQELIPKKETEIKFGDYLPELEVMYENNESIQEEYPMFNSWVSDWKFITQIWPTIQNKCIEMRTQQR